MRLGFSYVGLIYLLMLFLPNLVWAKNKPRDYEKYVVRERKAFLVLERVGEVLVTCILLVFRDFNLRRFTLWSLWLLLSFTLMVFYELYWARYFRSEKTMKDQYRSFLCFPVAGASLPVIAIFFLGIYGVNIWLCLAVTILGIGHIGIHLDHEREVIGPREKGPIALRILKKAGAVLLLLLALALLIPIGVRDLRFLKHWGNFIEGVEEEAYLPLGGEDQYVLMMGRNASNPVIIYLHGGPGSPDTMVMYTFAEHLMDDYTVIGWDQRGAGKTYYRNMGKDPENQTVSFSQALLDLDELVDYACERFGQEKVILMGHSYGTILGSQYVLSHPEKVSQYVGVGQMVSMAEGEVCSYEDALGKAKAAGEDTSEMERRYETFRAEGSITSMLSLRKEVAKYHPIPNEKNAIWQGISSPYFGVDDLRWFMKQMFSMEEFLGLNTQLLDYATTFDACEAGTTYQVPVHFFFGSEDWICPVPLIREYMDAITAPQKDLTLLEGYGHSPHTDGPKEFVHAMKEHLLP